MPDDDDDDEAGDYFEAFDRFDELESAPACNDVPWVVAMDRCRASTSFKERAQCMKTLYELSTHRHLGDDMREAGVIDFCIDVIRPLDPKDSEHVLLLQWATRAVRRIVCPSRLNRRRVREVGGIPVLIRCLGCISEPVAMEASHALKNTCYGHGPARIEVRERGGLEALFGVLLNPEFTNATWRAAVALCTISWANPINREIITRAPGVMEAIEERLGQLADLKTSTGLRALRKHIRQREAAAGNCASADLEGEKMNRRAAAAIVALNGTAADRAEEEDEEGVEEEEEDEEEGLSDDGDDDAEIRKH